MKLRKRSSCERPCLLSFRMRRTTPFRRVGGVFVCADRIGCEGATNFVGGSCVLTAASRITGGKLIGADALGVDSEGILISEVEVPVATPGDALQSSDLFFFAGASSSSGGASSDGDSTENERTHQLVGGGSS